MNTFRFEQNGSIGKLIHVATPPSQADADFAGTLRDSIRKASESDIRVLIVTAEGGNFAVTGSPGAVASRGGRWVDSFLAQSNAAFRTLEGLPFPTVASVLNSAMGGGFELVLACDFLVVAESAVLFPFETKMGVVPVAGGVQRLAERIGRARTARMVMLAEPVTGAVALTLGIATHVAPAERLEQATAEVAQHLANGPTLAYVATRGLLKAWSSGGVQGADAVMPELAARLLESEDARKAMATLSNPEQRGHGFPNMTFSGK